MRFKPITWALILVITGSSCVSKTLNLPKPSCFANLQKSFRPPGLWTQPGKHQGIRLLPGVTLLTGMDFDTSGTGFCNPELADPYVTVTYNSALISGTAQYHLQFSSVEDIEQGGPFQIIWNDFYYPDGTLMEGDRYFAHSWDMKPSFWVPESTQRFRLWTQGKDASSALTVWYGGHMRPKAPFKVSRWPEDNYSRDVFAFVEESPGRWISRPESIFSARGDWPRPLGNFLGHRYGHQIVDFPQLENGKWTLTPSIFYEEVTQVAPNGAPRVTEIFVDEMINPFQAAGRPRKLISPLNPNTGLPYPSAVREDGAVLVEGPIYFRFQFEGELWEGIGFSAGSYYAKYPAVFAARRVVDGSWDKPFQVDLNDEGSDFHDAGAELQQILQLKGGPGRPAVLVSPDGMAIPNSQGRIQVLVHGYRPNFPQSRVVIHAWLRIKRVSEKTLRFDIEVPKRTN